MSNITSVINVPCLEGYQYDIEHDTFVTEVSVNRPFAHPQLDSKIIHSYTFLLELFSFNVGKRVTLHENDIYLCHNLHNISL